MDSHDEQVLMSGSVGASLSIEKNWKQLSASKSALNQKVAQVKAAFGQCNLQSQSMGFQITDSCHHNK